MSRLLLNSYFRLYKANDSLHELSEKSHDELATVISKSIFNEVENNSSVQSNDLIGYNDWREVKKDLSITWKLITRTINNEEFQFTYLVLKHPNTRLLQRQLVIFIKAVNVAPDRFNTLVLMKVQPGLYQLLLNFWENHQLVVKTLRLANELMVKMINRITIQASNLAKIGDLNLHYNVTTTNNMLNHMNLTINNGQISKFANNMENPFIDSFYKHMMKVSSIDLQQLELSKIDCRLCFVTNDGRFCIWSGGLDINFQDEADRDLGLVYHMLIDIYKSRYDK